MSASSYMAMKMIMDSAKRSQGGLYGMGYYEPPKPRRPINWRTVAALVLTELSIAAVFLWPT